ncbi:MAG: hypothetical protein JWM16_585, partial [Verrucomicrobiales bacterium]|nr:hypothetical protein [Verrucomicrobiales bacterium]
SGDYAYLCTAGRDGNTEPQRFYILDLSIPSNPHYISSIQSRASAEEPYCMVVSDGYAYVADSAGLQVLNVQDGAHPVTMRTYPFLATCMAKANNLLCTWYAGEPHRLHFYEINAPGEVVSAGVLEGSWDLKSMAVTNHMLYLSDKRVGLVVLDVHNPASVKIAGGNSLKAGGRIFFSNDKLFLLRYDYLPLDNGVTAYPLFKPEVRFDSVSRQGPITLSMASPVGHNISLERSSNLRDWEPWQTIVSSNRVMHVVDPDPVLSVPRFYRAVLP